MTYISPNWTELCSAACCAVSVNTLSVAFLFDVVHSQFSQFIVRRITVSAHIALYSCTLHCNVWQLYHVWLDRVRKYKRCSFECDMGKYNTRPLNKVFTQRREGHGAMVRAWCSADVAACRAVSNPAWCRIFWEISCFSPLNLGTLLRCCVLGQGTSPSNVSLDSGENEYLVGQRWQFVWWVQCAETAAQDCMLSVELKWHTNEQAQWPGGKM